VISELTGLPDGVVGIEASGTLRAEDYRDVLLPLVERAAEGGGIRCVIVIAELDGVSGGALWQDMKMGSHNLRAWKRTALVTDIEWLKNAASMFGWLTPGEFRHFPLAERDAAATWAASDA
jgi:hypothetical protein